MVLPAGCQLTPTGLILPSKLPLRDWLALGNALVHGQTQLQWAIGDWWRYGDHAYGKRKALTDNAGGIGLGFQTCRNLAWVASSFEASRRRDTLSFKHHAEVAALPADEADALLDWCIESAPSGRRRTVAELRRELSLRYPKPPPNSDGAERIPPDERVAFPVIAAEPARAQPLIAHEHAKREAPDEQTVIVAEPADAEHHVQPVDLDAVLAVVTDALEYAREPAGRSAIVEVYPALWSRGFARLATEMRRSGRIRATIAFVRFRQPPADCR